MPLLSSLLSVSAFLLQCLAVPHGVMFPQLSLVVLDLFTSPFSGNVAVLREVKFLTPILQYMKNMLLRPLVFQLLLMQYTTRADIAEECHKDVSLPCNADFSSRKYFSVTWYKHNKIGIVRKDLEDKKIRFYNYFRNISISDENSLFLTKVTPEDSGVYECAVSAKVGHRNANLFVTLTVSECVTEPVTVRALVMDSVTTAANSTHCSQKARELPLVWSLLGYTAMGLTKIILSILIFVVFKFCTRPKHRW